MNKPATPKEALSVEAKRMSLECGKQAAYFHDTYGIPKEISMKWAKEVVDEHIRSIIGGMLELAEQEKVLEEKGL